MVKWNMDRFEIPLNEENMKTGNVSIIEHPHGGLILVFDYGNSNLENHSHCVVSYYYDEQKSDWNKQGDELHYTSSDGYFGHTTYLNMMGNLQMMYQIDHTLKQNISNDYGKIWKESDRILEDTVAWLPNNHPLFMKMGRVVLPVYDEGSGRSFAYISDDTGKSWFPSVFIEPSDDLVEISAPEDLFSCKMQSPTLIQAGERKLICFMQSEQRNRLLQAISNDFGETWSSAVEIKIPSGSGGIDAIRLRNSDGHYIPTVVIAFIQKKVNGKFSVNLGISSDIGESWDEIIEVDEMDTAYNDISIIQTDDNKLHIVYSSEQGVNHLVVNDFVSF